MLTLVQYKVTHHVEQSPRHSDLCSTKATFCIRASHWFQNLTMRPSVSSLPPVKSTLIFYLQTGSFAFPTLKLFPSLCSWKCCLPHFVLGSRPALCSKVLRVVPECATRALGPQAAQGLVHHSMCTYERGSEAEAASTGHSVEVLQS